MGQTLTHGVYLPDEGERNCYDGLAGNWQLLDGAVGTIADHTQALSGKAPLVHTHTKSDVTDLFNSANTWSALNSYSNGQIRIKSQSQEIGVIPSSGVIQYLEFADKNDAQHGIVGLWDYANGASEIQMYITDKFKNGTKDPTGTSETTILSFGFKTDGSKFLTFSGQVDNSVIPKSNNTYDLGSSSYQWNNLYAKNYYYNGTAWGLDKYNQWTGVNDFNNLIGLNGAELWFKNRYIDDFTTNPAEYRGQSVLQIWNKNTTQYSGGLIDYQMTDGSHILEITCFGYPLNDSTPYQHRFRFVAYRDGGADFYPALTNNVNLGTSTNKWKTLNGINPGALSLPSATYTGSIAIAEIDRTGWVYDGTANSYSPPVDCWLSVSNGGSIVVWGVNTAFGMKATDNIAIPLRQGETYNVSLTHTPDFCRIYPCMGNV